MKRFLLLYLAILPMALMAQEGFSVEAYTAFREQNKNLSPEELLQQNPPPTTYYSSRKFPVSLAEVAWFDSIDAVYHFTSDEKSKLEQYNFMVTERLKAMTWLEGFVGIYNNDFPLFLSTDFVLFTLHQSYDEILKNIEVDVLEPNLQVLLAAMYDKFPDVYSTYAKIQGMDDALKDADLFISVARTLAEDTEYIPYIADTADYHGILDAISSEQMVEMPLFTRKDLDRKLDFSQFKPRGHYTDNIYTSDGIRTLESYFRAMMWLGRIDFLMTAPPENPWEIPWKEADILRMNLGALLVNKILNECGQKPRLDLHEKIITFMVGQDDNLTPLELTGLAEKYLSDIPDLLNQQNFDLFIEALNGSDDYGQKIMSNFFYVDPDIQDPSKLPISFRLLGQKFLIDSYIFSEVVFDRIIYNGVKQYRMMPDPLDILGVFGNEDAFALLQPQLDQFKYAYKINELKYLVDAYDEDFWTGSLYNTWLSSLMKLNPPASNDGLPYFMQTTAWHHQKMNTQLTSWAQLRHDNILYAKQSYTGGTGCSYPHTYVEPYPDFYAMIFEFSRNARDFFSEVLGTNNPQLASQITGYYNRYGDIIDKLRIISEKELEGITLDDSEIIFLKSMINGYMSSGPSVSGWINELMYPAWDTWDFDFTVADVHTQPTDPGGARVGKILHVGNGLINLGVFIAPCQSGSEGNIAYIGPVASFHTEITRNFYRMDDDEWKQKFLGGENPGRPDWVRAYLLNESGKYVNPENQLKGIEYTLVENVPAGKASVDYLLVYPNPASSELRLRFILHKNSDVNIGLYDLSGRLSREIFSGRMQPDEHDIYCSIVDQLPGIYFIRMKVGPEIFMRKVIIK